MNLAQLKSDMDLLIFLVDHYTFVSFLLLLNEDTIVMAKKKFVIDTLFLLYCYYYDTIVIERATVCG